MYLFIYFALFNRRLWWLKTAKFTIEFLWYENSVNVGSSVKTIKHSNEKISVVPEKMHINVNRFRCCRPLTPVIESTIEDQGNVNKQCEEKIAR